MRLPVNGPTLRATATATAAAVAVAAALTVLPLAPASAAPPQIWCSTYIYNGHGQVDCTDNISPSVYVGWNYSGSTGLIEKTPLELNFYCTDGTAVSATLVADGNVSWYGTCA